MSMDKKHWIDEAMERDPFNKERPLPARLRNQLMDIPNHLEVKAFTLPSTHVWMAAAGLALLISINVFAISTKQKNINANKDNSIYSTYFLPYNSI